LTVRLSQKDSGAYFTPDNVVASLVKWAARNKSDRLLDPSCGDGRFIASHHNAVGVEQDHVSARVAAEKAPWALVHEHDFFTWAAATPERFECAAGNPPFIRYQRFGGEVRAAASALCERLGAKFTGLASSWAPFLVATASLLKDGGRMSFVVPAELGHAPYAAPLLEYLVANFSVLHVVAVRRKLFPDLSEDCWLLHAEGFGGYTSEVRFTAMDQFVGGNRPPKQFERVSVVELRARWNWRLRPYLMPAAARALYLDIASAPATKRFGEIAQISIGYVSGANDFFHLRPSEAKAHGIPKKFLHPAVRNGRALPAGAVTKAVVDGWMADDEPVLLLKLPKSAATVPASVRKYLATDAGTNASKAFKCRTRSPWYSVPDVRVPDFFLTYMSGQRPNLVRNDAGCTCTNSVHGVQLRNGNWAAHLATWDSEIVQLSAELEGHPLGGGMLKLEPREASQIILPAVPVREDLRTVIANALVTLRTWRHHGPDR